MSEPLVVYWEDEPTKTRVVERYCRVCYPVDDEVMLVRPQVMLVSPQGIAHHTAENDPSTFCGHKADGPEWWWRS